MGPHNPARHVNAHLGCETTLMGPVLNMAFTGSGEMADLAVVTEALRKAHVLALESSVSKVLVDFDELKFLNAGCFKVFAAWVAQVASATPSRGRYRIHFKLNPRSRWQKVSVSALSCFAADLVSFE